MSRDSEQLVNAIGSGVARLMDDYRVEPPPLKFWLEVRRMIRKEIGGNHPAVGDQSH